MKRYLKEGAWVRCNLIDEYGWVEFYDNGGYYQVTVVQSNYKIKNFSFHNLSEMEVDVDENVLKQIYIEMALLSGDKEWFDQLIGKGDSNETKQLA